MTQCLRVARFVPVADPADIGDGVVTVNPPTANKSIDTMFQLGGSGGGGGVSEAPSDGKPYVRQNAAWVVFDKIDGGTF
jgi:hypothetical protein